MFLIRIVSACIATFFTTAAFANCCYPISGEVGAGFDYFRSLPEGNWEGNTGGLVSFNLYTDLNTLEYEAQLGGSYGVYDWHGRASSPSSKQHSTEQQAFATAGVSRLTPCESGLNFGVAYDWMWGRNLGVFAVNTTLNQLRAQVGYLFYNNNEIGFWGTYSLRTSHESSQQISLRYRALGQANAFWRHIFCNGAETTIWGGVPYKKSWIYSSGKVGRFLVGGSFKAPLSNQLSVEGHASYMQPHKGSAADKQRNYGANICLELKWSFDGNSSYLPVANNSNFMIDTNVN